jgi:hypothetical protein
MRETYLRFVEERHAAWLSRMYPLLGAEVTDPIVSGVKFTNVFRVLDWGSQFLVRELLYRERLTWQDAIFRCTLYRYTNRPEPWEHFYRENGRYPVVEDLGGVLQRSWRSYKDAGGQVFGTAYRIFAAAKRESGDQLDWYLETMRRFFLDDNELVDRFTSADRMEDRLAAIEMLPRCGPFMSMQIITDMGYSSLLKGDEDEHIVAGPGATAGAAIVFPDQNARYAIEWAFDRVSVSIPMPDGSLRRTSRMDIQNTWCEFSKYARYASGGATRGVFRPVHELPIPFYPPHWYR